MRIIKRYENRKLYDTEDRKYVSLEDIANLIRRGLDVRVVDNASEADLTQQTLTQVIFEEGKRGRNPLSKEMLHDVIRWGNHVIDDGLQQVREGLDHLIPESLTRLFKGSDAREIDQLKKRIGALEELIIKLGSQVGGGSAEDEANKST